MKMATSNYKKAHSKLIVGGHNVVLEQSAAAPLLGTAIECDGGWYQITVLFTRRMPLSPLYVLGGVKISTKKANQLMAIAAIKKECERIWYTCPRFSGMPDSRIDEARAAFDAALSRLAAFDSLLVADCYQGCQAGNSSKPVWASPAHVLGL
jgi:hypothetical protein